MENKEDPIDPKSFSMKRFIMRYVNKEIPELFELGIGEHKFLYNIVKVFLVYLAWKLIIKRPLYRYLKLEDLQSLKVKEGMMISQNIVSTTPIRDSQSDYQRERFKHKMINWQS